MKNHVMALFVLSFSSCLAGGEKVSSEIVEEIKDPKHCKKNINIPEEELEKFHKEFPIATIEDMIGRAKDYDSMKRFIGWFVQNQKIIKQVPCTHQKTLEENKILKEVQGAINDLFKHYETEQVKIIKNDFHDWYIKSFDKEFKKIPPHEKVAKYIIHLTEENHEKNDKIMRTEWLNLIFDEKVWPRGEKSVENQEIKESYRKIAMKFTRACHQLN